MIMLIILTVKFNDQLIRTTFSQVFSSLIQSLAMSYYKMTYTIFMHSIDQNDIFTHDFFDNFCNGSHNTHFFSFSQFKQKTNTEKHVRT